MLFKQLRLSPIIPALAAIALLGMAGRPTQAQGVVNSSNVNLIPAPANVTPGTIQDNTNVTAFTEKQNLVLTQNVNVNISTPGTYTGNPLTPAVIPTGTTVDSFFFYSDPSQRGGAIFTGSITFNTDILGLITSDNRLDNSDPILGVSGTTYPTGTNSRGLELNGNANTDSITLSADRRTVSWIFNTGGNVDSVRVLTAVPEPAMALPLGLMLLTGLVLWRRRPVRQ